MGFGQLYNSIRQIVDNPHVPTGYGLFKHAQWQMRKMFDWFPFEQPIGGSRIVATHRRCAVSALVNSQGLYDYNNMKLVQWLLRDGGIFFDIGANIGSYTLVASEQRNAQVFAFEPHPATAALLTENVRLNNRDNVTVCAMALGNHDGIVTLTDHVGSSINHAVTRDNGKTVDVPCGRAETFCRAHGIVPNYVKVDVEGFEFDVLAGFDSLFRKVELVFLESNGLSDQRSVGATAIHSLLTSHGLIGPYRCLFDSTALQPYVRQGREDAIYLSETLRLRLQASGWSVGRME